jgi:hypothetical protein
MITKEIIRHSTQENHNLSHLHLPPFAALQTFGYPYILPKDKEKVKKVMCQWSNKSPPHSNRVLANTEVAHRRGTYLGKDLGRFHPHVRQESVRRGLRED